MTNKSMMLGDIDALLDTYCAGCLLKKQLTKDKGKTASHKFCISGCTIGDQLRFIGNEMNKFSNHPK